MTKKNLTLVSQVQQSEAGGNAHAPVPKMESARLIAYDISEAEIATLATRYSGLSVDRDYEGVREAVADLRGRRVAIDERRKTLNADALDHQRKVNARAKELTALIEAIETPLYEAKKRVDDAKVREKFEKENAERLAREETERQARAAEEAIKKAEREAEDKRLAEQRAVQEAEAARLREQQAKLDAQAKEQEAAQRRMDEQARKDREARVAEQRAVEEKARAEQAERDRVARETAEAARVAAMAPDAEKLKAFAKRLLAVTETGPELSTPEAGEAFDRAVGMVLDAVERLQTFGGRRR